MAGQGSHGGQVAAGSNGNMITQSIAKSRRNADELSQFNGSKGGLCLHDDAKHYPR